MRLCLCKLVPHHHHQVHFPHIRTFLHHFVDVVKIDKNMGVEFNVLLFCYLCIVRRASICRLRLPLHGEKEIFSGGPMICLA